LNVASDGRVVAERLDPLLYQTYIEEKIEDWTYLKSTFYKPVGEQEGVYRVGPLARLLVSERCGTPEADRSSIIMRGSSRSCMPASAWKCS
jgi:NAD-reducing hydrogenase large subunit